MVEQYDAACKEVHRLRAVCDRLYDSHTKQCVDPEYCRTCIVMREEFPEEFDD